LEKNSIPYSKDINFDTESPVKQAITEKQIVDRYGRQMLIPDFGRKGQEKLLNARVLIIGAGGIGAPAAYYLAAAGIGKLGLVDGDKVEESNLHRQIIHSTYKVGMNKAKSAKLALQELNPYVNIEIFETHITPENAARLVENYDIVLDATDNAAARYLINDICIIKKKTLVSGSALRWEGQLTLYGYKDGPCYRCMYPECPVPSMMMSCADGGVIGLVPGLVGMLESVEAIKLILGSGELFYKRMLTYDGFHNIFKNFRIRGCQENCAVCGKNPTITDVSKIDYEAFVGMKSCSSSAPVTIPEDNNIKWKEFLPIYEQPDFNSTAVLIDVRPKELFEVVKLDKAVSLPLGEMVDLSKGDLEKQDISSQKPIYVMCKRGIASKRATSYLLSLGFLNVYNIEGGFTSYNRDIDPNTPVI